MATSSPSPGARTATTSPGLLVVDGRISDAVVYFYPVFADSAKPSPRNWNIVVASFEDVFAFVAGQVIPDMKEWALVEDAAEL